MGDFKAVIEAELNDSKIKSQIESLSGKEITLKANTASLISSIQSALKSANFSVNIRAGNIANLGNINRQMQNVGTTAGNSFASTFSSSLNNIHLKNGGIGNINKMLQGAGFDKSSIASITQELDKMVLTVGKISTREMNNGNIRMTITGTDELNRAVQIVRDFDKATGQVQNTTKTFVQSFDTGAAAAGNFQKTLEQVNKAVSSGSIDASMAKINQQYRELNTTISNIGQGDNTANLRDKLSSITSDLTRLKELQTEITSGKLTPTGMVSAFDEYNDLLAKVKNNLTEAKASAKEFASTMEVATLQNKLDNWLTDNPRAAKQFGGQIQQYISSLREMASQGGVTKAACQEIADGLNLIDKSAASAGLKGQTFLSSFSNAFQSISKYVSASTLIYASFNAIKNGVKEVIGLDTALVDLQKTTTASTSQLKDFYFASNDIAKSLGVTTKDVIQSAADWSRLGYSIEDAQEMAKTSAIFASISPGMDIAKGTDALVSAMKAFDIEATDALDGIASKINIIGNTQAVSNADIVEFLTRSSSAMKEANNTLEQTIALGTAATEITRDAASVGNVLKTTSMRLRGYDEDTNEYIGGVEELSGAIADLTKTSKTPGGISLFKDAAKTEYKSTYEILRDISEVYDELTDKQQADLLEKLAGKRNGQAIAAILNNFDAVEKSLASMENSAGNAMKEMEVVQESLAYKLNALKETGVGIFQNLFQTEDIGNVVSALTGILGVVDAVTEKLGTFGTIGVATGIGGLAKSFA